MINDKTQFAFIHHSECLLQSHVTQITLDFRPSTISSPFPYST